MLRAVLVSVLLVACLSRSLFLGLNGSKFFYNYRMVSNLLALTRVLHRLGLTNTDMLLLSNQASFNHWANHPPNTQRLEDDDLGRNLLTAGVEVDLMGEDVSLRRHLMGVAGRFEADDPLNKRLRFGGQDTIFIFFTGHGGDYYLDLRYRETLFAQQFADAFHDLFISGKVARGVVVSDSCSAGTLFHAVRGDVVDALLLGASTWGNPALSMGFDKHLGQPLKDRFSYLLIREIEEVEKGASGMLLTDLLRKFTPHLVQSTLLHFNHLRSGKESDLRPFFSNPPQRPEVIDIESHSEELGAIFGY